MSDKFEFTDDQINLATIKSVFHKAREVPENPIAKALIITNGLAQETIEFREQALRLQIIKFLFKDDSARNREELQKLSGDPKILDKLVASYTRKFRPTERSYYIDEEGEAYIDNKLFGRHLKYIELRRDDEVEKNKLLAENKVGAVLDIIGDAAAPGARASLKNLFDKHNAIWDLKKCQLMLEYIADIEPDSINITSAASPNEKQVSYKHLGKEKTEPLSEFLPDVEKATYIKAFEDFSKNFGNLNFVDVQKSFKKISDEVIAAGITDFNSLSENMHDVLNGNETILLPEKLNVYGNNFPGFLDLKKLQEPNSYQPKYAALRIDVKPGDDKPSLHDLINKTISIINYEHLKEGSVTNNQEKTKPLKDIMGLIAEIKNHKKQLGAYLGKAVDTETIRFEKAGKQVEIKLGFKSIQTAIDSAREAVIRYADNTLLADFDNLTKMLNTALMAKFNRPGVILQQGSQVMINETEKRTIYKVTSKASAGKTSYNISLDEAAFKIYMVLEADDKGKVLHPDDITISKLTIAKKEKLDELYDLFKSSPYINHVRLSKETDRLTFENPPEYIEKTLKEMCAPAQGIASALAELYQKTDGKISLSKPEKGKDDTYNLVLRNAKGSLGGKEKDEFYNDLILSLKAEEPNIFTKLAQNQHLKIEGISKTLLAKLQQGLENVKGKNVTGIS